MSQTKEITLNTQSPPLSVFSSSLPPKSSMFYEHRHTAFEITMVISGSGIYSTKYTEFEFKSGDVFFFSTDEIHWIKKLNCKTDFLNIHFEPRFIWSDNFGISNNELMKIFLNRKKNPINKLTSPEPICDLIFKIEKEISSKKPEYETMIKVYLTNILVEMIRSYEGKLSKTDISYSEHMLQHMEKAINFIDDHISDELTLEEISDIAHMSKTYFCRQFKKLNGIPPWEYITIKRIERAISYIETTDLTKLEIALKCGYNNTANFYYAFKRITGKTPSDYEK